MDHGVGKNQLWPVLWTWVIVILGKINDNKSLENYGSYIYSSLVEILHFIKSAF